MVQAQAVVQVPVVLVVNSQGELWRPWHSIAYIAGPATFVTIFINRLSGQLVRPRSALSTQYQPSCTSSSSLISELFATRLQ